MLPSAPSSAQQELKQPEEVSMPTAEEVGSTKVVTERDDQEHWNVGGDGSGSNSKEDDILLQSVETEFPGSIFSTA